MSNLKQQQQQQQQQVKLSEADTDLKKAKAEETKKNSWCLTDRESKESPKDPQQQHAASSRQKKETIMI